MAVVNDGVVGMLFGITSDAALILEAGRVVAWNPAAERLLDIPAADVLAGGPTPLDDHLTGLLALPLTGPPVRLEVGPLVVEATHRRVEGRDVVLLRDLSREVRHENGLRLLASASQEVMAGERGVPATLQTLVGQAKRLTGADFSALLILREGSATETSHFVYDAPRNLFPTHMPRVVGLLSVPVASRAAARLDDIRGHPAGKGLPGVHPPIGPLLAVPLLAGHQVLGELAVANRPEHRSFDDLDEQLLTELAAFAVLALRWARSAEEAAAEQGRRQEVADTARHDIRTPLGAGKGYTALLRTKRDRMTPEQVETALEGLAISFDRIEAFAERLLVDERLGPPGAEPQWALVSVQRLLEQVRRDAEATTGRPDAVVLRMAEDAPTVLAGDAGQVLEVVENLVGNALKYAGHAGPVTLSVRSEGDHVRLDVRDDGPGIAEADQDGLFERGARSAAARSARVPGLGLGLSIVRRLVRAHGGLCGVSSRPGEGATFWVTFPSQVPA